MMSVGDIMSTPEDVQYTGIFHTNSIVFPMTFP